MLHRGRTGLRNRDAIGIENIACSDCTWPNAPEHIWKSLQAAQCTDREIDQITWENACRFYSFDPFQHRTREQATVGALRAASPDVDTTPKSYGKQATFVPQGGLPGA